MLYLKNGWLSERVYLRVLATCLALLLLLLPCGYSQDRAGWASPPWWTHSSSPRYGSPRCRVWGCPCPRRCSCILWLTVSESPITPRPSPPPGPHSASRSSPQSSRRMAWSLSWPWPTHPALGTKSTTTSGKSSEGVGRAKPWSSSLRETSGMESPGCGIFETQFIHLYNGCMQPSSQDHRESSM